jgi:hypothetical protein
MHPLYMHFRLSLIMVILWLWSAIMAKCRIENSTGFSQQALSHEISQKAFGAWSEKAKKLGKENLVDDQIGESIHSKKQRWINAANVIHILHSLNVLGKLRTLHFQTMALQNGHLIIRYRYFRLSDKLVFNPKQVRERSFSGHTFLSVSPVNIIEANIQGSFYALVLPNVISIIYRSIRQFVHLSRHAQQWTQ